MTAVPPSVPSSVPSATNTVPVLGKPQLGPHVTDNYGTGKRIPVVPHTDTGTNPPGNPRMGHAGTVRQSPASGGAGAPSVPANGSFWHRGPIDPHYQTEYNPSLPSAPRVKVNNPPTRGMFTLVLTYLNHIARSQDVDNTGFRVRNPQQRTSVMRVTPPAHGIGYAPATYTPRQMPQQPNTYQIRRSTGSDPYGSGVLNTDTLGAGQTAGGIGGNQYTPQPGPPATSSTADQSGNASGMPTWG